MNYLPPSSPEFFIGMYCLESCSLSSPATEPTPIRRLHFQASLVVRIFLFHI